VEAAVKTPDGARGFLPFVDGPQESMAAAPGTPSFTPFRDEVGCFFRLSDRWNLMDSYGLILILVRGCFACSGGTYRRFYYEDQKGRQKGTRTNNGG